MAIWFEFTKMPGHGPLTGLAERFFARFDRQQTVFERRPLETQAGAVRAADGYRQLPVFVPVLSGQCHRAFPVDQAGEIGGIG